jgi:hypothetical protein
MMSRLSKEEMDSLLRNGQGQLRSCIQNAFVLLPKLGANPMYDTSTKKMLWNGKPLSEVVYTDAICLLEQETGITWRATHVERVMRELCRSNPVERD